MQVKSIKKCSTSSRRPNGSGALSEIPAMIGKVAAEKLYTAFGGAIYSFPRANGKNAIGMKKFHDLVAVVGIIEARKLCDFYGGGCVYIPMNRNQFIRQRNIEICAMFDSGVPVIEILKYFGIGESALRAALKEVAAN